MRWIRRSSPLPPQLVQVALLGRPRRGVSQISLNACALDAIPLEPGRVRARVEMIMTRALVAGVVTPPGFWSHEPDPRTLPSQPLGSIRYARSHRRGVAAIFVWASGNSAVTACTHEFWFGILLLLAICWINASD